MQHLKMSWSARRDLSRQRLVLSNAFYIDDDVFKQEQRAVFFSQWCGVGFAKDAAKAGDATPITFLGMPLLLVRDRDDTLPRIPKHLPSSRHDSSRRAEQNWRCDSLPLPQLVLRFER